MNLNIVNDLKFKCKYVNMNQLLSTFSVFNHSKYVYYTIGYLCLILMISLIMLLQNIQDKVIAQTGNSVGFELVTKWGS